MSNPDALLVLGGGVQEADTLTRDSEARVETAAELFHQGGVDNIVFSGGLSWLGDDQGKDEATLMAELAKKMSVPSGPMHLVRGPRNTIECIAESAALLSGAETIGIVSQPYHRKRCLLIGHTAFVGQDVQFVEAEPRDPHNMWAERASLVIARTILHGVEPGDTKKMLARNDAYIKNASALRNASSQLRAAIVDSRQQSA